MSGVWIKICGLREQAHIDAAIRGGADAIGFVFAESPRAISPSDARSLAKHAGDRAEVIAVMRHPSAERWAAVLDAFTPDRLQTDADDFDYLNVPAAVKALPVYRDNRPPRAVELERAGAILYESQHSGSGELADWRCAAKIAQQKPLVLAGGLDPDNVANAIAAVKPWGVDVSSGIEIQPGVKDSRLIEAFCASAHA